ncbi:aminotransferase class I/II-fold pyridoxal phosphate-dependent enzyme [Agarivorans albus]|uniref:GDP-perosamine synthase n=1 Tax=Agarivorans albus MKT 106 TaxID=1331007 RepID=R9PN39_AGAAL|nr:aminotransferase class I/II-fold pyridoxal phosphate-dependent enzyme [Agarivorans albus]GAD02759.1 degT/DnrJ/EryC1/StrS aminotransferase [Agarivorans albus MKT 106]
MVQLQDLCIEHTESLKNALIKIDDNAQGLLFVVEQQKLLGILTDGDVRRSIISGCDITGSITEIFNKNYVYLHHSASVEEIQQTLNEKIKVIPLLDDEGKLVDFSSYYRLHRTPVLEPLLGGNELEYVTDCIKTNWVSSQGKYVQQFEQTIMEYTRAKYALAVSNGTVALHLALVSLGIGPGDEVIVPDITFGATLNAVVLAGAKPVIVDVEPNTWNMSIELLIKALSNKTKAIMPVHIYGIPCNMPDIITLAKKHELLVVEDCAEALGSSINGQHVGTFGDVGTFSFFGNKVITCGEGGAVIFKSASAYEKAKVLRDHGMTPGKRYWHDVVGYNYRLTNLQAAIGCAQFEQLETFREKRSNIFSWYEKYLLSSGYFSTQQLPENYQSSLWLFTAVLKSTCLIERDNLISKLAKLGIDSRPIFYPMSDMPPFKDYQSLLVGNAKAISKRGISLPTSVYLSEKEVKLISEEVINCIAGFNSFKGMVKSNA